jgi:hypothetical protein
MYAIYNLLFIIFAVSGRCYLFGSEETDDQNVMFIAFILFIETNLCDI